MYTIHNITDDFHGPKNDSNPSEREDFPEFHPWPHLTSFAQLPHYCYLTATATTTLIFHCKRTGKCDTSVCTGTAQLETLVCIAQRSFSSPFSESTRTVLSPRLSFLPIWKWSCALRNHHNILLWFFESGKSSWESGVPGVRKQTFTATAISKPDSGKFCLLLITNIFLYCIQIRISQLSHFKPLGVFLLF